MMNKRKLSALSFVLSFALMAIVCLISLGQEALAVNFSSTCEDIVLKEGRTLEAQCQDASEKHTKNSTKLDLNTGIGNRDGFLERGRGYIDTCREIKGVGVILEAACVTYDKSLRPSRVNLNEFISNDKGQLKFD